MGDRTTIALSKKTRDRLARHGRKGETYESIILRLMGPAQSVRSEPGTDPGPDVA